MKRTRNLTTTGVLSALAVVLGFISFPVFMAVPYLTYDFGDIPILLGAFAMGPGAGFTITVITAVIMGMFQTSGGIVGVVMHILSSGSLAIVAALVYRRFHNRRGALLGLIAGTVALVATMVAAWLSIVPAFWFIPLPKVVDMLLPIVVPFNLIKGALSGTITFIVYRRLRFLLKR